ncbi:FliG C-terminal domain-containing protein [Mangrovicella endophytica]|uniref:FliG C-terminal domain-containing protein n=1 Tax=Mangrovicella endophytica TaxID=2066697 RepID=UPI000C9DDB93|nr:FliG C-terminal domain-containing protein [Mangrovicella endophytica]
MSAALKIEDQSGDLSSTGAARAAILLLAMGTSGAARLLKHLTAEEIRAIRQSAMALESISREELDELVEEFQEAFKIGPGLSKPGRQMKELLQQALSEEELATVLDDSDDDQPVFDLSAGSVWDEVEKLDREVLVTALSREHPQVVAVLLSKVEAQTAADIVIKFPSAFRNEVMRRMLAVKQLAIPVRLLFETHLRQELLASPEKAAGGRHAALADIVNRMDKEQSDELLKVIAATKPADAVTLRSLLFSFEDVIYLPAKARFVLFDAVPTDVVIRALNRSNEEIRECVLSALGARARRMVEAELAQNNEIPDADINAARRTIATSALRLAGEGKIQLREAEPA